MGLAAGVIALIAWLGLRTEYSQATPDDVLKSAIMMVKDGKAERLSDLMYADNVEYRVTLTRLGKLCGTMQELGQAINDRFPQDVARARETLKKSAEGKQASIISAISQGPSGGGGGGGGGLQIGAMNFQPPKTAEEGKQREEQMQAYLANIFADPFGWLADSAGKLTTEKIADDTAVIKYDGEPLLGGLITLKQHDNRWWIVLPLHLPGVSAYSPQTRNEWQIVASLLKAIDNAMIELRDDVRSGKVAAVDQLGMAAGEKAFIPAAVIMAMYAKEMDVRSRREKALASFKKRWREFEKARQETLTDLKPMSEAVNKAAIEGLDKLIRKRTLDKDANPLPKFEGMPDTELTTLVEGWLSTEGAKGVKLTGPITRAMGESASAAIDAHAKSGIRVKPPSVK